MKLSLPAFLLGISSLLVPGFSPLRLAQAALGHDEYKGHEVSGGQQLVSDRGQNVGKVGALRHRQNTWKQQGTNKDEKTNDSRCKHNQKSADLGCRTLSSPLELPNQAVRATVNVGATDNHINDKNIFKFSDSSNKIKIKTKWHFQNQGFFRFPLDTLTPANNDLQTLSTQFHYFLLLKLKEKNLGDDIGVHSLIDPSSNEDLWSGNDRWTDIPSLHSTPLDVVPHNTQSNSQAFVPTFYPGYVAWNVTAYVQSQIQQGATQLVLAVVATGASSKKTTFYTKEQELQDTSGELYAPMLYAEFQEDFGMRTANPTASPTTSPTTSPTSSPTSSPTNSPTTSPTASPTTAPTAHPTASPTAPTTSPTTSPTNSPTLTPTASPSSQPSLLPSLEPSSEPSVTPLFTYVGDGVCVNDEQNDYLVGEVFQSAQQLGYLEPMEGTDDVCGTMCFDALGYSPFFVGYNIANFGPGFDVCQCYISEDPVPGRSYTPPYSHADFSFGRISGWRQNHRFAGVGAAPAIGEIMGVRIPTGFTYPVSIEQWAVSPCYKRNVDMLEIPSNAPSEIPDPDEKLFCMPILIQGYKFINADGTYNLYGRNFPLATILDEATNNIVKTLGRFAQRVLDTSSKMDIWLPLDDLSSAAAGQYVWKTTGSEANFTDWKDGFVAPANERSCAFMSMDDDFKWDVVVGSGCTGLDPSKFIVVELPISQRCNAVKARGMYCVDQDGIEVTDTTNCPWDRGVDRDIPFYPGLVPPTSEPSL